VSSPKKGRTKKTSAARAKRPAATPRKPAPRNKPPARRKKPQRARAPRRMGVVPQVVALILVLGLAGAMAIQPTRQLLAQRDRISEMSDDLRAINQKNKAVNDRIERLNNPDYLEQIARDNGLARPGETVYNVVPPSRKELKQMEKRKGTGDESAPEPEPSFMERFIDFVGLG